MNPSELRELARQIERGCFCVSDLRGSDDWADRMVDWANDKKSEDEPPFPPSATPHEHALIVDALRQAADAAELEAAIQRTARYRAELEAML
jgi:hypothetical protein